MSELSENTYTISQLNDRLRQTFWGGKLFMSAGLMELAESDQMGVLAAVRDFDDFTEANDPHDEHDFGKLIVGKLEIIWKIDYYDQRMEFASPNPADPEVTERVLTIMLASEY